MEIKKRYWNILLILFFIISVFINNIYKTKTFISDEATYIFPRKTLKIITFGYDNLIADFYYIWAIQFYSSYSISKKLEYLVPIMETIAELDPEYLEPFPIAGMIAALQGGRLDIALKILNIGMKKNPSEWTYPMEAGYYLRKRGKYKKAILYYDIAAHKEDSPVYLRRVIADMLYKSGDVHESYKFWSLLLKNAKTKYEKEVAYHHVYDLKVKIDKKRLSPVIKRFKNIYGRYPLTLKELYYKRFISYIPTDYDGNDYIYDNKTGEFTSRKKYLWK
jgi:tetratricopeptide (TPR) repeat protein